jgi:hypothetical protein
MDNGGSRPEYDRYHRTNEAIFLGSLRNERKSPIRDQRNRSPQEQACDITTYLNWPSSQGRMLANHNAKL